MTPDDFPNARTRGWTKPYPQAWTVPDWLGFLTKLGVGAMCAAQWAEAFTESVQPARFSAGLADVHSFVAQFLHETALLKKMREDLNYSAERLMQVWPSRFTSIEIAKRFEYQPRLLANFVYGGRMGNRPGTNDGWDFIGRGAGITGRTNYGWLAGKMEQDLLVSPQLLEQPHFALEAFFWWWEGHVPDRSLSDQVKVRKVINGGGIGLEHCKALFDTSCKVLVA